jgi:hypothetical protein
MKCCSTGIPLSASVSCPTVMESRATWSHAEPAIRLFGQAMAARVDHDQPGPSAARRADPHGGGGLTRPRVGAPEQDAAGLLVVWSGRRHAIGMLCAPGPVPGADMRGGQHVRAAKGVGQTVKPIHEVHAGAACRGGAGEDDGLGAIVRLDVQQAGGYQRQRLIPRDLDPTGVWIAFGPRASQGVAETGRRGDDLGSGRPLDADAPVGMLWIGGHLRQAPVLDGRQHTAAGGAHSAVGMNLLTNHPSLLHQHHDVSTAGLVGSSKTPRRMVIGTRIHASYTAPAPSPRPATPATLAPHTCPSHLLPAPKGGVIH